MIINNVSKVQAINAVLYNNSANVIKVNCNNVHWVNNSAASAFASFPNLTTVSNIGNTVEDVGGMFYNCRSLVNAPTIPASVNNITFVRASQMYYGYQLSEPLDFWGSSITALYLTTTDLSVPQTLVYMYYEDYGEFMDLPVATAEAGQNNTVVFTIQDYPEYGQSVTATGTRNSSLDQEGMLWPERYESVFTNCTNLVNAPVVEGGNLTDMSSMYAGCTNLVNVPAIPNGVTSLNSTFSNCTSLVTAPTIPDSVISMTNTFYNCTSLETVPTLSNSITSLPDTFSGCQNLVNVPDIPNSVTYMSYTFYNCRSLLSAPNIPANVTNFYGCFSCCNNLDLYNGYSLANLPEAVYMSYMFSSCSKLVNAPILPASVRDNGWCWSGVFHACTNMINPPTLPNGIVKMNMTFYGCTNMATMPDIPNTVVDMPLTFSGCTSLVTLKNIPASVNNMYCTFSGCTSVTGDIYIESSNITNAAACFNNTTATKNVCIPLKYANNVNTATYNAFINAGYSMSSRVNGVQLYNIANYVPPTPPNSIDVTGYEYSVDNGVVTLTDAPVDAQGAVKFPNIEEE